VKRDDVVQGLALMLPWSIRRRILHRLLGYELHPTSRIGFAWVSARKVVLEANASIGHGTVCRGLDLLWMKDSATIGRGNWITGLPSAHKGHYEQQRGRQPQLIVEEHAAITSQHLVDCTNSITLGRFSTIAGFRSQLLTHTIDLERNVQTSAPITIGEYCFVGTNSLVLGNASLPSFSVLASSSLLNKSYSEQYQLYGGVPAVPLRKLSPEYAYFKRATGFVE
jgi:acetyltransferase-like isoleucine patch superfamily enzyme